MHKEAIIIAAIAVSASSAFANNILINPGFETGNLNPFYQSNDFGGPEDWHIVNSGAHSGTFCTTDVGNKQIRQDFAPIPVSDIMEVSLWVLNPEPSGSRLNGFEAFYSDGSSSFQLIFQPDTNWNFNNMTALLTPGKELTAVSFWGYIGDGPGEDRSFTDDWTVDVVPSPATALALPLLAAAKPRRRR